MGCGIHVVRHVGEHPGVLQDSIVGDARHRATASTGGAAEGSACGLLLRLGSMVLLGVVLVVALVALERLAGIHSACAMPDRDETVSVL
jgi:hypothetical protein